MAINLNPGADAAIVTAATRAGLASGPGDYSKQFESIAQSYAETMQSNVDMWKTIMDTTLALSKDSIIKAGERHRAKIDVRNTPGGEALETEINDIAEELRKTRRFTKEVGTGEEVEGPLEQEDAAEAGWSVTTDTGDDPVELEGTKKVRNNPFSRENRDKRADIYKRRDAFYAEVAQMGAGLKVINNIQASGEFDAKATGAHGIELAEAFAASQTTGEHTENGNYFESSYDRKKGKIIHTLMNDGKGRSGIPKGPVKDEDGNIRTYTTAQIQDVLVPKDPNLEPTYTKIFNAREKDGKLSGRNFDEYQSNRAKKSIEPLIETSAGLHRSIHATFGHLDKSFHEEFTSISELSAKEYAKLANVLPKDEQGNLRPTGVLRGVDGMSDGKPGIQQSDFANTQNQNRISLAMFDKGDKFYSEQNLKDTFVEWIAGVDGKLAKAHNYGVSYNSRVLADKRANAKLPSMVAVSEGEKLGKLTYANMFEGGKDMYIPEEEVKVIKNIGTSMTNRSKITGPHPDTDQSTTYTWINEGKYKDSPTYITGDGTVVPNKATMLTWLFKNQTINPTFKNSDFFKSIPEWDGSKWVNEDDGGGGDKSKAVTIKNDIVKQVKLPWIMGMSSVMASDVKKINGAWHVSEKVGYSGETKWVKATQKQINKINKLYK